MRKAIAKIKLAPGNVAWYDPLSNVYLTLTSPEAFIYDDDNIYNIKNGIRHNCVLLKEGILPSLSNTSNEDYTPLVEKEEIQVEVKNIKDEDIIPLVEKEEPINEIKIEEVKAKNILKGKKKTKDNIKQKNSEITIPENSSDKDKKE